MPCQLHENKSVLSREASLHVTAFWKVLEWGRQIRTVVYLAVMLFVKKKMHISEILNKFSERL